MNTFPSRDFSAWTREPENPQPATPAQARKLLRDVWGGHTGLLTRADAVSLELACPGDHLTNLDKACEIAARDGQPVERPISPCS